MSKLHKKKKKKKTKSRRGYKDLVTVAISQPVVEAAWITHVTCCGEKCHMTKW